MIYKYATVRPIGHVAELVYAYDSESYSVRIGSSTLPAPTVYTLEFSGTKRLVFMENMVKVDLQ